MNKDLNTYIGELLNENPKLRNNDNMLIAVVCKHYYGYTDVYDIALNFKGNIFESIRRSRAKWQETNPNLRADKDVQEARLEKEKRVREEMRGV